MVESTATQTDSIRRAINSKLKMLEAKQNILNKKINDADIFNEGSQKP